MFGFGGTSNTAILGIWQTHARTELPKDIPAYLFSFVASAVSGDTMFSQAFHYSDLSTAQTMTIDQSNDYDTGTILDFEGYIRRALADGKRIVPLLIPRWSSVANDQVDIPMNADAYNAQKAVCEHYGLSYVDYWGYVQSIVPAMYDLSDLYGDVIHLTATGGEKLYDLVQTKVAGAGGSLVSELNTGASDMAQAIQKINGVDNDGTTGAGWSTNGTAILSTTANDTITFVGTFRKFGCYRTSGANNVTVSIDGGAFQALTWNIYGIDTGSRAEHTIVVKVVTDCRVDEFWAI